MVSSSRFQDHDFEGPARPAGQAGGPEAVERLLVLLKELTAYAGHYLAARLDSTTSRLRRIVLLVACAAAMAVSGLALLGTATVLFVVGMSQAMAAVCQAPTWAGHLMAGGGIIGGAIFILSIGIWQVNRMARSATFNKYEQKKRNQRERFGRDAAGPAAAGPAQ